jgi:hypothetical protein
MSQPVAVLNHVRTKLAREGPVLVIDERVGDGFAAPADDVERMMYGWTVLHCLPVSRAESISRTRHGLAPPDGRMLAFEAGFRGFEILDRRPLRLLRASTLS